MGSTGLTRKLGYWDSVAISIGIVIGVGIFRVPADVAAYLKSPQMILLAWVLGGIISMLGVLCYSELSSCFPHTGGTYVYLRESYGKLVGFLFGWMEFTALRAGSIAGVAYVFAAYLGNMLGFDTGLQKYLAIGAVWVFTAVNILGLHYGTRIQNALSALKVLTLAGMTVLIFVSWPLEGRSFSGVFWDGSAGPVDWLKLAPALIPVLWSYGGWNESTFMAGEFTETKRDLPRALIGGIILITVLYLFMNAAYLYALPPQAMIGHEVIASDIFEKLLGRTGLLVISIAVLISAGGGINSTILTGARIPFAVALDHRGMGWIGKVHERFQTPARAYALNAGWTTCLILWGSFTDLLFFTGFAKWFFFTLAGTSVFVLRNRYREISAFRMAGYPWVPAGFTLVSAVLFATTVFQAPKASLFGWMLLLLGIPVFMAIRYFSRHSAGTKA